MGSNLNKSKTAAGMPVAAGKPHKRRRNNPSRLRRNARKLQHFFDRKASSGSEPPQPVVAATFLPSNTAQDTTNEKQVEHAEADEKNVLC